MPRTQLRRHSCRWRSKARAIRRPGSLGSWLHGVALRVATACGPRRLGEGRYERRVGQGNAAFAGSRGSSRSSSDCFTRKSIALPFRYRAAIVACDLEGLPPRGGREPAAPLRADASTRLYRGRERLRLRLIRGGFTLAATGRADFLSGSTQAAISTAWIEATSQAAARITRWLLGALGRPCPESRADRRVAFRFGWSLLRVAMAALVLSASTLILGGSLVLASRGGSPQRAPYPAQPSGENARPLRFSPQAVPARRKPDRPSAPRHLGA